MFLFVLPQNKAQELYRLQYEPKKSIKTKGNANLCVCGHFYINRLQLKKIDMISLFFKFSLMYPSMYKSVFQPPCDFLIFKECNNVFLLKRQ